MRALAALPEHWGSILSSHMAVYNCLQPYVPVLEDLTPSHQWTENKIIILNSKIELP